MIAILTVVFASVFVDLNSPLLFGRLNGLSSDSTIDILYQLGTTQDSGTKDRYINILTHPVLKLPPANITANENQFFVKVIFQTDLKADSKKCPYTLLIIFYYHMVVFVAYEFHCDVTLRG